MMAVACQKGVVDVGGGGVRVFERGRAVCEGDVESLCIQPQYRATKGLVMAGNQKEAWRVNAKAGMTYR